MPRQFVEGFPEQLLVGVLRPFPCEILGRQFDQVGLLLQPDVVIHFDILCVHIDPDRKPCPRVLQGEFSTGNETVAECPQLFTVLSR